MHDLFLDTRDLTLDRFVPDWPSIFPRPATVRILIVYEEPLVSPGPPGSGFSLGRVVSYLRNESFGFVNFVVDFASHGADPSPTAVIENASPGDWGARYDNFRFHSLKDGSPIIDDYDQVWCFGEYPFIHNDGTNDAVEDSPYSAAADEMAVMSAWMDAGGGVLAMGDHNFLGSAMAWNMPRVGTMRAWRKDAAEDGRSVPNRTGTDRHDTNRPQNAAQDPTQTVNPSIIPNSAEQDTVTQPLEWKRYHVFSPWVFQRSQRPHPVLCGGNLGVIDRFPDHPHEGLVVDPSLIDFDAKCQHDPGKDEYPTVGGVQPKPEVIAWVNTLPSPPYRLEKLDQPARRIGAIGVYDGHAIDHGRVVVDSTWHHWFDLNIAALESADTDDFKKIKRYFQNTAIWLSRKSQQQAMLNYAAFWTVLTNSAIEELSVGTSIWTLATSAIDILGRATSDCLVHSWLIDRLPIPIFELEFWPRPLPDPCWSCPPIDLFTHAVMGSVIQELLPHRDAMMKAAGSGDCKIRFDPEIVGKAVDKGVNEGLRLALKTIEDNRGPLDKSARAVEKALACGKREATAHEKSAG
ncbi:MAG: hypothetical protein AAF721_05675 [Myxococcota bacterium]